MAVEAMLAWPSRICTIRMSTPFSINLVAYEWRRVWGVTSRRIPAAAAAAAKVRANTRGLSGASPRWLWNSQRGL